MKSKIRGGLDSLLAASPAQKRFMGKRTNRLAVLAYHGVDDAAAFERHLDLLMQASNVISLDQLLEAIAGREDLPPNPVLITFDDGERNVFDVAVPLLEARGLPALAFVVAGLLDTDEPYWWVEVERRVAAGGRVQGQAVASSKDLIHRLKRVSDDERVAIIDDLRETTPEVHVLLPQLRRAELPLMEAAGVAIGNHSLGHRCLSKCSSERIESEIVEADAILTEVLGHPLHSFAYPDGGDDDRAHAVLVALGYEVAFLFDHHLSELPLTDPLEVSRVRVNSSTSVDRFAIILSGLHPAIHKVMKRG